MTTKLVIDASAALAILRQEPEATAVRAELASRVADGTRLLVPDIFWLEVVNVLLRRYAVAPADVAEAIRDLDELGVETTAIDRPLLLLAIDRSDTFDLTTYDAAYLALAEVVDADLLTLDGRLASAAGPRARPRRPETTLAETAEPYRARPPMEAWAGFGAFLAELRRRDDQPAAAAEPGR